MHVRAISSGQRKPDGFGARREQEAVERIGSSACQLYFPFRKVERRDLRIVYEVDAVFGVESRRAERDPFLRRVPGEIILREVGPIVR
jgi:hypothetical protein